MKKNIKSLAAVICSLAVSAGSIVPAMAVTRDGNSSYYMDMTTDSYPWAIEAVDYLTEKGVAHGIGDNLFSPSSDIKRGDFVILLDKALKLKAINTIAYGFNDVPEDSYYYTSVINAKGNGIVTNVGSFFPDLPITRIDAFLMMYRALQVQGYVKGYGTTDTSMYADEADLVNTESKIAVGTLTAMDILHGKDGNISPNEPIERAEMAVLIQQTMLFVQAQDDAENAKVEESIKQDIENEEADSEEVETTVDGSESLKQGYIYKPVTIDTDKTLDNCTIRVSASSSSEDLSSDTVSKDEIVYANQPAISISGNNNLELTNSKVFAYGIPSAIKATGDSSVTASNVQITANASDGVVTDGNASFKADNTTVATSGSTGTAVIANGGTVQFTDSKIASKDGEAVQSSGATDFIAENTEITANSSKTGAVNATADYYDSKNDVAKFLFKGCNISNALGVAFYINNVDTEITLNGDNTIEGKYFLYTSNKTTKSGSTETDVTVNINDGQKVKGDVYVDDTTKVQFNINKGGSYEGSINSDLVSTKLNVYLSDDAELTLTGDCYVSEFVVDDTDNLNFQNIIDNGNVIYYDASLEANYYLDEKTFSLQYGGELKPRW